MSTTTPADFMAMTDGPDFEVYDLTPPESVHQLAWRAYAEQQQQAQPFEAELVGDTNLTEVLERLDRIQKLIEEPIDLRRNLAICEREYGVLVQETENYERRIEQVLAAIKTSTSKVAIKVREILQPEPLAPVPTEAASDTPETPAGGKEASDVSTASPSPAPEVAAAPPAGQTQTAAEPIPGPQMPSTSDDVEVWRAYARTRPYNLSGEAVDLTGLDQLNRSQIRTLLGIDQPVIGNAGTDENAEG